MTREIQLLKEDGEKKMRKKYTIPGVKRLTSKGRYFYKLVLKTIQQG